MIIDSPEYQAAHSSELAFINGIYTALLGRNVDPAGLAYWQSVLQGGASRDAVAYAVIHSDEMYLRIIDQSYQNILHRGPSPAEEQYWLAAMQSGAVTVSTISQDFLDSAEFLADATAASRG
jgi:hypothetical protein